MSAVCAPRAAEPLPRGTARWYRYEAFQRVYSHYLFLVHVLAKQENRHKYFPEIKAALHRYSLADRIVNRTSANFFEYYINIAIEFPNL